MSAPRFTRRWGTVMLTGMMLPGAAFLLLPGAAGAAQADTSPAPSTVQATIGAGGAVKSAIVIASNGSINSFGDKMPLTMSITSSVAGGSRTTSYHIENTTGHQQTVHWTLPDGTKKSARVSIQLPLVAQLVVSLPASATLVTAPGAAVTTNSNRSHTLLYNLVLSSPLGAPVQDVSFTVSGSGAPTATLHAALVSPTTGPGLSAAAADANQNVAQTGSWTAEASAANTGLGQLKTGVGALVTGLQQLATGAGQLAGGLGPALTGAKALNAGAHQAKDGAQALSGGINQIHVGQVSLTGGLRTIHSGQQSLTGGLSKIHSGQQSLTSGLDTLHSGQATLTSGLDSLHSGQEALTGGLGDRKSVV